ncbi:MAG: hypothetical protein NTY19_29440 [Planctomycetota bacterium]|nr:hypothetical protein [Planctomycetota bacterium]
MSTTYEELLQAIVPRPISCQRAYHRALKQVEILGGKRTVSKTNAVRLAKFFGVPIDEFLAGEGL